MTTRSLFVAMLLVAAACAGGAAEDTTTTTTGPPATSPTTTTAPATTTTTEAETTTTTAPTTTTAAAGDAVFAVSEVVFGESGYVEISNVGDGPGTVDGLWLCQRPAYAPLPDVELQPGQSVWVTPADAASITAPAEVAMVHSVGGNLGAFRAESGEMGLYQGNSFGDSSAILSFVQWGDARGSTRNSVAVEAGIWPAADAFVDVPADAFGITAVTDQPQSPDDWTAAAGG